MDTNSVSLLLQARLGYGKASADATAADLACLARAGDPDIVDALAAWLRDAACTPIVAEGEFSTTSLCTKEGMHYPAALLFIDWLRHDHDVAIGALRHRCGGMA